MNLRVGAGALLLVAALAGCAPDGSAKSASGNLSTTSPTSTTTGAPTIALTTTGTATTGAPGNKPIVVLETDGLGFQIRGSSIRHLAFADTSPTSVTTALKNALGDLTETSLPMCRQGARTSVSVDGFSALYNGEKFVGWTDQGASARGLTTANGIGVGLTFADLQARASPVKLTQGSLGTEWTSGSLHGLLDGTQPTSRITAISAGETCSFR